MNDENKKSDTNEVDADKKVKPAKKSEASKKPDMASKKVSTKDSQDTDTSEKKKKIIEKLQAMGVMSGGKSDTINKDKPVKGIFPQVVISVVVVVIGVGLFVWVLNDKAVNDRVTSKDQDIQSVSNQTLQPNFPGRMQPYSYNSGNGNSAQANRNIPGANNATTYNDFSRDNKYWQQEQQRLQEQRQKWAQQQQLWIKQQQQAQEQQRAQQQEWAKQQQAQQQKWAQQQNNYGYPPYGGYQGQPAPFSYNYGPGYQQPGLYYGR